MIILGIVLALLGYFLVIPILTWIGFILVGIGLVLTLLGVAGHTVGGRRTYY
jgi:hypothetical protein